MVKHIIQNSFYQLILIYSVLVLAISLSFLYKFALHFEIFALVIAIFGISIITFSKQDEKELAEFRQKKLNKYLHYSLFAIAIILIILFRIIPYFNNSIPLGYDAGLYKYGIENGLKNLDKWILAGGMEPGFLYAMFLFKLFFSSDFILKFIFIGFEVLLGVAVYLFAKEYFNEKIAIISILLYAVSVIQFDVFTYMYYKNIIALSLMLFSFLFLKKAESSEKSNKLTYQILFIIFAAAVGAIHRPTFYILGLSYFFYAFISPYKKEHKKYDKKILLRNLISGIIILAIVSLFYIGQFSPAITNMFSPVLNSFIYPGESPGTFISFTSYQFMTLAYLPFAILGIFYLFRKKEINILLLWALITLAIVYFQFFFFNRFIIHLDIALIILASLGFYILISHKKKFGIFIFILLMISAGFSTFYFAEQAKPQITANQLGLINQISQKTEENACIISITSEFSPFILGYSERKTIAPGLFDYDKWAESQWKIFWTTKDRQETISLMSAYSEYKCPVYLFAGSRAFDNPCFETYLTLGNNSILKYIC